METYLLRITLAILLIGAVGDIRESFGQDNFGDRAPSVDEIVGALVDTRSLRPASISMQLSFEVNSATISDDSAEKLSVLAQALRSELLLKKSIKVVGHTDASGSPEYNMELSMRRAKAVEEHLVGLGVDPARLSSRGKGETELLNREHPTSVENRRVQFIAVKGRR